MVNDLFRIARAQLKVIDFAKILDSKEEAACGVYLAATAFHASAMTRPIQVYASHDGSEYNYVATIRNYSLMGFLTAALPSGTTVGYDDANTMSVSLYVGDAASRVDALVEAGLNDILVGSEIVGFGDAALVAGTERSYDLTHLLRARRGSTVGAHSVGAEVVFLDQRSLVFLPIPTQLIGETIYFKALTEGLELTDVSPVSIVFAANNFGAMMHADISPTEGFVRKTAAKTYTAVKSNLSATTDPGVGNDSSQGYGVGSMWVNTTGDKVFFCADPTVGAAVWAEAGGGSPAAFTYARAFSVNALGS